MSDLPARRSRIAAARARVHTAKKILAIGAVSSFAAALLLARVSHPGNAATTNSTNSSSTQTQSVQTTSSDLGELDDSSGGSSSSSSTSSPSIAAAPAQSQPQVQ